MRCLLRLFFSLAVVSVASSMGASYLVSGGGRTRVGFDSRSVCNVMFSRAFFASFTSIRFFTI